MDARPDVYRLLGHRDCGMLSFEGGELSRQIEAETGIRPSFNFESFDNLEGDVRQSIARVMASPFLPSKKVRGFTYDVATGKLEEVS